MPSIAGGACMWRTRKCAEGRSALRRWRVASKVGCSRREDILEVREGVMGCGGGAARWTFGRRVVRREDRVGGEAMMGPVEVERLVSGVRSLDFVAPL